jgi:two-component system, NtrC family, nitrogen regulation sensor histidine kinase NtrY
MIRKNFRVSIFLRVNLIAALSILFAFVVMEKPSFFVPLAIGIVLILAVVSLIRYIERSNKDLTHFLLSIRSGAFTESYTSKTGAKMDEALSEAMNEVIGEFAKLNAEREIHYQYLKALNENINVAILSFDTHGKLKMMNPAAKRLLNLLSFSHIEHFKRIDIALYETVNRIQPEERIVTKVFINGEISHLSIQMKEIVLQGEHVKIILLQNLNNELEAKEIEAWYQLIRVLTHEIMNSVTPIVSLTAAIQSILTYSDGSSKKLALLTEENQEDVVNSLSTITARSKGLLKFVNAYKEYAKPLALHPESTDLAVLITRIIDLLKSDLEEHLIHLNVNLTPVSIPAKADIALMEQVLINLIKNAMEAVAHDGGGIINVGARVKEGNIVSITVSDNGSGIDPETMPKIFIPFFTTKSKGTGIGLSLSRQIIKLHGGNIKVSSSPGKGSVFTVEWRS